MRTLFKRYLYVCSILTTALFLTLLWFFVRERMIFDDYMGYLFQIERLNLAIYVGVSAAVMLLLLLGTISLIERRVLERYDRNLTVLRQLLDGEASDTQSLLPELGWLAKEIQRTLGSSAHNLQEAKNRQQHITTIMNEMQEGIVLLNERFHIMFINRQAQQTFALQDLRKRYSFIQLYRNEHMVRALYYLKETGAKTVDLEIDNRIIRASLGMTENGYTIYTKDVTQALQNERLQRDFSANVSHALKTPVTSIMGFAQLIATGMVTDPEQIKTMGETIASKSADLVKLIDDTMQLAYLETTDKQAHEPIAVRPIAQEVLDWFAPQLQTAQLSASLDGDAQAHMHPSHLRELLLNLVENAVKYNRPHGSVSIELDTNPQGRMVLTVADTGIGMEAVHVSRIQERYYRVPSTITGNGLGLNIVDTIAKLYEGQLSIESELGVGTQIRLVV